MRPRVVLAAVTAFASAGVLVLTATASPAKALDPNAVQTVVVGGPASVLLPLQVDQLYPGIGTHARFVVQRGSAWSGGTYAVSVTDVKDLERGCNRPELNAGDVTCGGGDDQGELSEQLLVNASWSSDVAACATAPVPAGVMSMRLADGVPFAASAAASAADACLVVALQLPIAADNLVQSDLVRFSLRIGLENAVLGRMPVPPAGSRETSPRPTPMGTATAIATPSEAAPSASSVASPTLSPIGGSDEQAAAGSPSAAGTRITQPSAPVAAMSPQPRALPFTGGQPLLLAGWAALMIFAGRVLVLAARQRRA